MAILETQDKAKKPTKLENPNTTISQSNEVTTKNFLLLMGLITAAAVLVGGYVIYVLANNYIRSANEVKAQDQLIAALDKKVGDLEKLKPNYAQIMDKGSASISDGQLILRALPITEDYKSLIASLEKIGEESGVRVTSVSQSGQAAAATPTTTTPSNGTAGATSTVIAAAPKSFSFTINIEGPYDKIFTFLQNTEKSSRVINFSNMTLSGNSGSVTSSLTMKTYWQDPANINSTMRPLQ